MHRKNAKNVKGDEPLNSIHSIIRNGIIIQLVGWFLEFVNFISKPLRLRNEVNELYKLIDSFIFPKFND